MSSSPTMYHVLVLCTSTRYIRVRCTSRSSFGVPRTSMHLGCVLALPQQAPGIPRLQRTARIHARELPILTARQKALDPSAMHTHPPASKGAGTRRVHRHARERVRTHAFSGAWRIGPRPGRAPHAWQSERGSEGGKRGMAAYIAGRGEPIEKDAPLSTRNVSRLTTYELRQELVRRDKLDIPDDQINHRFATHLLF